MLEGWKFKVEVSECDPRYEGCKKMPSLDRGYDELAVAVNTARDASRGGWFASVYRNDGECLFEFIDGEPYAPAPY